MHLLYKLLLTEQSSPINELLHQIRNSHTSTNTFNVFPLAEYSNIFFPYAINERYKLDPNMHSPNSYRIYFVWHGKNCYTY